MNTKELIASRIAQLLCDGEVVNLGIGIPTLVPRFVPDGVDILLHSDNGILGIGPEPEPEARSRDLIDAGGEYATALPGAVFLDSATDFGLIRGGHLDVAVLGALEVDQYGGIASWDIPGVRSHGIGGSMDLCTGAKRVIVGMTHCNRDGASKVLRRCRLPLTATGVVKTVVTDLCVMQVEPPVLVVTALMPCVTKEMVLLATEADLEFRI
ncbi:MAG: 3-oxoacid CoA-transferase subunit B [Bacillota bacterium]